MCVHAAFFVVISAWHPTPIFRRVAPVPMPVHSSCTLLRRLAMTTLKLSEKACSLLRDFMLVFDLEDSTLKAMLQKIESAFPKTFTAVSTEGAKVEDSATFFEERKAEIVTFVQEFLATLMGLVEGEDRVEVRRDARRVDERLEVGSPLR